MTGATIGGTLRSQRNVISGNGGNGVHIVGLGTTDISVVGNLIGTDWTGTQRVPNTEDGVRVEEAFGNRIGGAEPGARNVISGNGQRGVLIEGKNALFNTVQGNFIGVEVEGEEALPNLGHGVYIEGASFTLIGGTQAGARNIISGNGRFGVLISGYSATQNQILNNYIGLNARGTQTVGNSADGVKIESLSDKGRFP